MAAKQKEQWDYAEAGLKKVTVFLRKPVYDRMKRAASKAGVSLTKLIASLVEDHTRKAA